MPMKNVIGQVVVKPKILEIEINSKYWKYEKFAYVECLTGPIGQPSLSVSRIWSPLISN
jgi:hypothetical protein